jgi:phosphomannomutase
VLVRQRAVRVPATITPVYDPVIFREYDIRGRAPELLSPAVAEGVGKALGTRIRRRGGRRALVGRDVRHSSPALAAAAAAGLSSCGLDVLDLCVVPTPVLYHGPIGSRETAGSW